MNLEEAKEKAIEAIAENLSVERKDITPTSRLIDDLGADSLDLVETMMALETLFEISIPDSAAEKMVTVGDILQFLEENQAQFIDK